MRGKDEQQLDVFSYISPEQRVPHDHALRPLRVMTDEALGELQPRASWFKIRNTSYSLVGRSPGTFRTRGDNDLECKNEQIQ